MHVLHGRVPADETDALLDYLNSNVDRFRTWAEWHQRNPETKLAYALVRSLPDPGAG